MRNPTRNNGACCFILVEESAGYIQILNSISKMVLSTVKLGPAREKTQDKG